MVTYGRHGRDPMTQGGSAWTLWFDRRKSAGVKKAPVTRKHKTW